MGEPYIGEIRIVAFTFPPRGWAECNGQLLAINQNQALFSILGTTYGGNGQTNFALPDLRGRLPMHFGNGAGLTPRTEGEVGGTEAVTLLINQMPPHIHQIQANSSSTSAVLSPNGAFWGGSVQNDNIYATTANTTMNPAVIGNTGGSQPHPNLQPSLTLKFVIALVGIFPSRS